MIDEEDGLDCPRTSGRSLTTRMFNEVCGGHVGKSQPKMGWELLCR